MAQSKLDEVVSLAKRRGFVFPAGEIYGGTRSAWDYGPLGVALKDNIKREWWRSMVVTRPDVVGVDTSIILPPEVWVASGHVSVFNDPLVECLNCHKRNRADKLEESYAEKHGDKMPENGMKDIVCPNCGTRGQWTEPRDFNMMLRTHLGPVEDENSLHYLRPETAQGIFVDFKNVMTSSRSRPPFGIANMGKSFRNEITPGNFIFRTREFEQMEMEFFVTPGTDEEWHQYWIDARTRWYIDLGVKPENLRHYEHPKEKLAHYSKRTVDIEYKFGFQGSDWGELEGIANRTDYDLSAHSKHSGEDLSYFNQATGEKYVPYVIEPAAGLTRSLMCFLVDAYDVDEAPNTKGGVDKRTVLHLDPRLAPVKAAVLKAFPKVRMAHDQFARIYDVAFDFAEDEPKLPLETAYAVAKLCRDMGAEAKVSSIHVNAWFGAYSKADMAAIYLKDYCHADDAESEAMFFGDSPNDEPMFAAFPLSCGVANIAPFADRMAHLPAYILDGEGGYGFAEAADIICKSTQCG